MSIDGVDGEGGVKWVAAAIMMYLNCGNVKSLKMQKKFTASKV